VAGLAWKINREPRENGIHRFDAPEAPTFVHAEAAGRQLNQWFNMSPFDLARRR
jgi:hypothetical protein